MARTTVLALLPAAPALAARALVALAGLEEEPAHDVVLVDPSRVGLEELVAAVEGGDVRVVRPEPAATLAGQLAEGLAAVRTATCVVLLDGIEPGPTVHLRLLEALAAPGVACAAAGEGHPATARALALRIADVDGIPDVPDAVVVAALQAGLARHGEVVRVPRAVLEPAPPHGGRPPHAAFGEVELSVVVPTLDATSERFRRCVGALREHSGVPLEVIAVDNGPMPQGFSAPVNSGLRAARGAYLVVCNDDVRVLPGWWGPLRAALDEGSPVAFPQTVDGAMRDDLAAWCFALSRDALEHHAAVPGHFLHPELVVWYQDTDLLHRLRAAGLPPRLVSASRIRHGLSESVGLEPGGRPAWLQAQILRDRERFRALHGDRVEGAAS